MKQYLMLDKFNLRKALCRFRISAHDLRIESGWYSKNPTDKSDRICTRCGKNEVEDESLSLIDKGIWLVMQEDLNILESRKLCRVMLLKKKEVHCIIAESLLRLYSWSNVSLKQYELSYMLETSDIRHLYEYVYNVFFSLSLQSLALQIFFPWFEDVHVVWI